VRATKVNAGLAESNGRLLLGIWRDSLHFTCRLTACTPGSAPGPTLGNEYGKTLSLPAVFKVGPYSLSFKVIAQPSPLRRHFGTTWPDHFSKADYGAEGRYVTARCLSVCLSVSPCMQQPSAEGLHKFQHKFRINFSPKKSKKTKEKERHEITTCQMHTIYAQRKRKVEI